jgi:hypothetical protein
MKKSKYPYTSTRTYKGWILARHWFDGTWCVFPPGTETTDRNHKEERVSSPGIPLGEWLDDPFDSLADAKRFVDERSEGT